MNRFSRAIVGAILLGIGMTGAAFAADTRDDSQPLLQKMAMLRITNMSQMIRSDVTAASCRQTGDRCSRNSDCCAGLTCGRSGGKLYCY